jgi:hypothetical protein
MKSQEPEMQTVPIVYEEFLTLDFQCKLINNNSPACEVI